VVISNCVINLSADKPRVLAEAFRVLRPGGRLGVSDIIADDNADPAQIAAAEQRTGCTTGTATGCQYRRQLLAAGFTQITITPTAATAGCLHSAIIQAVRPAAPAGATAASPHPGSDRGALSRSRDRCHLLVPAVTGCGTSTADIRAITCGLIR